MSFTITFFLTNDCDDFCCNVLFSLSTNTGTYKRCVNVSHFLLNIIVFTLIFLVFVTFVTIQQC